MAFIIPKMQDIQANDVGLWETFERYWKQGNYVAAYNLLVRNQTLTYKYVTAQWLNQLKDYILELIDYTDEPFKEDKIKLVLVPVPPALEVGEIYYQAEIAESDYVNVQVVTIPKNATSVTCNYVGDYLIEMLAFQNGEKVECDITFSFENKTVTFTAAEPVDAAVTGLVISTKGTTNFITKNWGFDNQSGYHGTFWSGTVLAKWTYARTNQTNIYQKIVTDISTTPAGSGSLYYRVGYDLTEPNINVGCYLISYTGNFTNFGVKNTDKIYIGSNDPVLLEILGNLVNLITEEVESDVIDPQIYLSVWTDVEVMGATVKFTIQDIADKTLNCTGIYS